LIIVHDFATTRGKSHLRHDHEADVAGAETSLRARQDHGIAGKPGPEEDSARVILPSARIQGV
jgi:hypothetical protein